MIYFAIRMPNRSTCKHDFFYLLTAECLNPLYSGRGNYPYKGIIIGFSGTSFFHKYF